MKKYLILFTLLTWHVSPAFATETVTLDAGQLTGPIAAPMQVDNTFPSSNGSLLLLVDLGSSDTMNNTLTAGNFVSGTNFILAAGGFNNNSIGGPNETITDFTLTGGNVGDDIALEWFPQITYAQYLDGTTTAGGDFFGTYAPSPLGSTPDGGNAWTVPSSGAISLNLITSNNGGSQSPDVGFTNNQVSSVPEPSTYELIAIGSLVLFMFVRRRKAV